MSQQQTGGAGNRDDVILAKIDEILALLKKLVEALGATGEGRGLGH